MYNLVVSMFFCLNFVNFWMFFFFVFFLSKFIRCIIFFFSLIIYHCYMPLAYPWYTKVIIYFLIKSMDGTFILTDIYSLVIRKFLISDLTTEEYSFGRGENCDVAFNTATAKQHQCFQAYSKVHFKLIRVGNTNVSRHTVKFILN